jgi:predicted AAA+ superfamily ATPase
VRDHPTPRPEPPPAELSPSLESDLRRFNPWWSRPGARPAVPELRRHLVDALHYKMGLALAPIVVVRGPRQVGKTTAQLQVLTDLLERGIDPRRILRLQCDELPELAEISEPILRIADWYESSLLGRPLNDQEATREPAYLFVDEVQTLEAWAPQLKFLVDSSAYRVIATGSSAMRIEAGRDSLAGRITSLEIGTLSLTEIARFHGFDLGEPFHRNGLKHLGERAFWERLREHGRSCAEARDRAFALFAERGGYPLVHRLPDTDWDELADQLDETVIQRMLKHDLRADDPGHSLRPALLEAVFRLACRYAGQAPSPVLLAREASATGLEVKPETILEYLDHLDNTLLIRLVKTLEIRLKRSEHLDKICLADHSLRASWLGEIVPLEPEALASTPHLGPIAGRLAESVVGARRTSRPQTIHGSSLCRSRR